MKPCRIWGGWIDADGYGRRDDAKLAHRAAYEAEVAPVPSGMELDHLCRNRACVEPSHLEPVTHAENMRRAFAGYTHCKQGHEFTPENTYIRPTSEKGGVRQCRACNREAVARYKNRKRSAA